MATDNEKVVQQEGVGQTTPPSETGKAEQPAPEPSPEQKLAELVKQQVAEEVKKLTEASRREIQSAKDRAKAEVERATRELRAKDATISGIHSRLQGLDPDVAKEAELAELKAERESREILERERAMAAQQEEFHNSFIGGQTEFIKTLGIDPADTRIDWAGDAPNYLEAMRRIQSSVAKIQKENQKTMQDGFEKRLKDLETKVSKPDVEANSVNTSASQGAIASSDREFLKNFASGSIPLTKENVTRYTKLLEQE